MEAAKELYALEQQRPLNAEQTVRWQELAKQVFPRNFPGEQRQSNRIPGMGKVVIGVREYDVLDVSWGGLRLQGEALPEAAAVTITAIQTGADWQPVNVQARVVHGRAVAVTEPDAHRRHDFFAHAYYPLYMNHLKLVAKGD